MPNAYTEIVRQCSLFHMTSRLRGRLVAETVVHSVPERLGQVVETALAPVVRTDGAAIQTGRVSHSHTDTGCTSRQIRILRMDTSFCLFLGVLGRIRINSISETNGSFDSCYSCKGLLPSYLNELHGSTLPCYVSCIECIRSKLSIFSAYAAVATVMKRWTHFICRLARCGAGSRRHKRDDASV